MRKKRFAKNGAAAMLITSAAILGLVGVTTNGLPAASADTPVTTSVAVHPKALQPVNSFLNSFYKPALKGQFPENLNGLSKGLTIGTTTRKDVIKKFGQPFRAGTGANAFDEYEASMGQPGFAFSYQSKSNKLQEMRYLGTGVERQYNLGGITQNMLIKQWGMPNSTSTIKAGEIRQKKLVYIRGKYQLEFIFDSNTNLNHVNLNYKSSK